MPQILPASQAAGGLLDTRYEALARNTIDYWMLPEEPGLSAAQVLQALEEAPVHPGARLDLYLHVPFCAQHCAFCAFSGGNSLEFQAAARYARLLVEQLQDQVQRSPARGLPVRSVNIGGGSPDLLREHVDTVLQAVRALPGVDDRTEIAVEFTLSTVRREFIESLVRHGVTKVSFGVQSLDPEVRRHMRQPVSLRQLDQVLSWIGGRIPVVNADLITGMPGQDLRVVNADLRALMAEKRIHAISSYLLTAGAAPAMLALVDAGKIPPQPAQAEQALMRLHSYSTFLRQGWVRRGTNTYVNPDRVPDTELQRLQGNECIGAGRYEAFLLAAGPQAVSSIPGARIENLVDVEEWCAAVEAGAQPFHLPKCATTHVTDLDLWVFPLRWEGLPQAQFDRMLAAGALSVDQLRTIEQRCDEGLIVSSERGLELTILGEVFMGQLVRDLKKPTGRAVVDEYIEEGHDLAGRIAAGQLPDSNSANNRQKADRYLV